MSSNPFNTQMVDLKGQYRAIEDEVNAAVKQVMESAFFIKGPAVQAFERNLADYLGCNHVIGCANGTDALQLAIMALDLEAGDEVIVPAFTFIATAEVVSLMGLTPIFADVDPDNFNILPDEIERKITSRTKAIMPVHLFGQSAPMDEIMSIANRHNLYVIEDAAQSIGASYKNDFKSGTIGHIGTTSFFPSKNLGAYGDGGAVFTNDDKIASRIKVIANHGMEVRYYHDVIGINSRLDSIQAAILDVKLRYLDQYGKSRIQAADIYDRLLADVPGVVSPHRASYSEHIFHQYTLKIGDGKRDAVHQHLLAKGVPNAIYYPVSLHKQKAFAGSPSADTVLPNSEKLNECVLSLPMHTELKEEEQAYIIDGIKEAL